ncbi:MAG: hypothetical protein HRT40_13465 [Campylobacteraceae bacterium]|nr:hypothetical protein [Campylobacteraceae bacterium]
MNKQINNFDIVNNWLGWGDPKNGLWFIGMEEREVFKDNSIEPRRNRKFDTVSVTETLDWPIAKKTAKIISKLCNIKDVNKYRDSEMWHDESKIFNGNLFPLGKPSLKNWPNHYKELFGYDLNNVDEYILKVEKDRYENFKKFKLDYEPQAIICFGKGYWDKFEEVFVKFPDNKQYYENLNIVIYETDKVILTGHISYGTHFTNQALNFVVETLSRWNVLEDVKS